jgi:hypothetical protein
LSILNTGIKDITNLTTKDVVVVWGGTRDVSKNEAIAGLSHIQKFVEKYNNTNVLVMELPDRCDLSANSCVNVECKSFNRKLRKYMQPFKHASVVEIYCNRSHYTRHGLHLNYKVKEFSAKQIQREIETIFREVISIPAPLNWLDKKMKQETKESDECNVIEGKESSLAILSTDVEQGKYDQENEIISIEDKVVVSRKLCKAPVKLSKDFLWTKQSKKEVKKKAIK